MAAQNKIIKYQLTERVLELRSLPHEQIAEKLTSELRGKGIDDSISQPSVSRWLKKYSQECKEKATAVLNEYLDITLPADLKILDELSEFYLIIFRDRLGQIIASVETVTGKIEKVMSGKVVSMDSFRDLLVDMKSIRDDIQNSLKIDLRDRFAAGDRLHAIIQTKLRWIGIDPGEGEKVGDLSAEDKEIYEKLAEDYANLKIASNKNPEDNADRS